MWPPLSRRALLACGAVALAGGAGQDVPDPPPPPPPSADDLLLASLFASARDGDLVRLDRERTYRLTRPLRHGRSVRIDLNGSRLVGSTGLLVVSPPKRSYARGGYFNARRGTDIAAALDLADLDVRPGELLRMQSDTLRLKRGGYRFGELATLSTRSRGRNLVMQDGFLDDYQVDRIDVFRPITIELFNGGLEIVDAAKARGRGRNPAIAAVLMGAVVRVDGVTLSGDDFAGGGLFAEGDAVRLRGVRADGFLDLGGIPGGGRLGYGMTGSGRDVQVEACGGSNCKHVIESASRDYVTARYTVIDAECASPAGAQDRMMTTQGGERQPVHQYLVGCHANVGRMTLIRPRLDGVNSLIGVRNGWAEISDAQLTTRGVNPLWGGTYLVNVAERAVENVYLRGPVVTLDMPMGGPTCFLVGVQREARGGDGVLRVDGGPVAQPGFQLHAP